MPDEPAAPTTAERVDFAGINALSSRPAGYAVALKCLQVQAEEEERDPNLRSDERVVLHPDAWSWYQGAVGEMAVGQMLAQLGPEWFVRHSVPIGAGTKDVDHLVIGPAGVFAINTKHHAGASVWVGDRVLRVNNGNTRHLPSAAGDAQDVTRRLEAKTGFPVPVRPVLAVLGARALKDGRAPQNRPVAVVDALELVSWLQSQPQQLSAAEAAMLKLAAEEPQTWHVDPRAADTHRVMQRFERLVARVGPQTPPLQVSASPKRQPTRRPAASAPKTTRGSGAKAPVRAIDLLRPWGMVVVAIVGILVFRAFADQPCTSPTGCLLPPLYLAIKPFLILGIVGLVASALLQNVARLLRRDSPASRKGRRR
ncbi:nuclease-related domain-containing protein [Leifsonia sp. 22587]|uniref:nuclease-related domain-containing protein n=1 Tax=Leifsonia sp. 22587 TaxID=3453946 RepID=UPI003F8510A7